MNEKVLLAKDFALTLFFYNINLKDVDNFNYDLKNRICNFTLKNGEKLRVPLKRYKINKKHISTLALTLALSSSMIITGSLLNKKFKEENGKVELLSDDYQNELSIDSTIDEYEDTIAMPIINDANINNNVSPTIESTIVNNEINNAIVVNVASSPNTYEASYNKIINNYYSNITVYSNMYGIDPALLAAIIMQEGSTYNPNETENYQAIGLLQLNGNIWNNYTFNTYNFSKEEYENYTVDTSTLMNNPDEQIKLLAIMLQHYGLRDNYNIVAMIEEHNKGMQTVDYALDRIRNTYGYNSRIETLNNISNPMLIEENINRGIGDYYYLNNVCTYLSWIKENNVFSTNENVVFLTPEGLQIEYTINLQERSYNR